MDETTKKEIDTLKTSLDETKRQLEASAKEHKGMVEKLETGSAGLVKENTDLKRQLDEMGQRLKTLEDAPALRQLQAAGDKDDDSESQEVPIDRQNGIVGGVADRED
jgi:septal ring factor EnvC (AmiA/AmiB activator)